MGIDMWAKALKVWYQKGEIFRTMIARFTVGREMKLRHDGRQSKAPVADGTNTILCQQHCCKHQSNLLLWGTTQYMHIETKPPTEISKKFNNFTGSLKCNTDCMILSVLAQESKPLHRERAVGACTSVSIALTVLGRWAAQVLRRFKSYWARVIAAMYRTLTL